MRLVNPAPRAGRPMLRFLPALRPKANGCGLFHSLLRSTDVGVLDDLRPLGDFGRDIAIERIGRGGVDGHSEIGEALRHLRVQPQHDVAEFRPARPVRTTLLPRSRAAPPPRSWGCRARWPLAVRW